MVVDKYKSGFEPPPDIPFEDLNGTTVSENHNHSNSAKPTSKTLDKMTMSGGKGRKRGGLFGIFGGSKVSKSVVVGRTLSLLFCLDLPESVCQLFGLAGIEESCTSMLRLISEHNPVPDLVW